MLTGESCARRMVESRAVILCDRALAAVTWGYLAFAYAAAELHLPHIPVCPYLFLTGTPCPLCGSTRWIGALLHGEVVDDQNSFAAAVWLGIVAVVAAISLFQLGKSRFTPSR